MNEQHHHTREAPRPPKEGASISDVTVLVRIPGSPTRVRAFAADERPAAEAYAAATGGTVVPLPLGPPPGYTAGADGNVIPVPRV